MDRRAPNSGISRVSFVAPEVPDTSDGPLARFTEKLLKDGVFDCGSCGRLLTTPVMLVDGHGNACRGCYAKLEGPRGVRNVQLEAVLSTLRIPCKFQATGCKERVVFRDLEEHQAACRFHTKKCLMVGGGCAWEGIQTDLPAHLTASHPNHVLTSTADTFGLKIDLGPAQGDTVKLLSGKIGTHVIKVRRTDSSVQYAVCDLKNAEPKDSECTVKHRGPNPSCVETKCRVAPFDDLIAGNWGAVVDLPALKQVTGAVDVVDVEVVTGDPDEIGELDEKMLQHFECPVCKNLMKPPIYQCKFGHSFCNACRPKLEKCPNCRGVFGSTRNYSLEGLTAGVRYACVYRHLGCDATLSASDSEKHEGACPYKPYQCPMVECSFTGNCSAITSHLNTLHPDQVIPSSFYKTTVDFRMEQLMDFYNYCQKYFMIFDDNIFRLSFKRNSDYSFWAVETLRKYDENAIYVYEIGIVDMRRHDRKLIRTDLCFPETGTEELFKKCVMFPNNTLSSYASNGLFTYYCQVHRKA